MDLMLIFQARCLDCYDECNSIQVSQAIYYHAAGIKVSKGNANSSGKKPLQHKALQIEVNSPPFMQHLTAMAVHQLNSQQQLKNRDAPNNSTALS